MLIDTDSCGAINPNVPVRRQLSGTYTAPATGLYTVELYNYRPNKRQDLQNYFDELSVVPQATDFSSDTLQFSVSAKNLAVFSLDAGSGWAGWKYLVLLSASGNDPGFTNNGVWVPLTMDSAFWTSVYNRNSGPFVQTNGILDANGHKQAALNLANPMGSSWLGRTLNVSYILYQGPGFAPISYASMPVSIFFIP